MMNVRPQERSLFFAAVLLAAGAVLVEEHLTRAAGPPIGLLPFVLNVSILVAWFGLLLAMTGRPRIALGVPLLLYAAISVGNRLKIRYLLAPAHPADVFSLADVRFVHLQSSLAVMCVGTAVLLVLLWLAAPSRRIGRSFSFAFRVGTFAGALAVLSCISFAAEGEPVRGWLKAGGVSFNDVSPVDDSRSNGLLLHLAFRLGDLRVERPLDYGPTAVALAIDSFGRLPDIVSRHAEAPPNLVLYVVEALMDPDDLGLRFTSDPIPFLRSLGERASSGWTYAPEFGGRSANSEFELLTGLSIQFLPPESVAYNQFVRRPLPALPRFLSDRGYRTAAVHADTLRFFNYPRVYRELGFQSARTIRYDPGVALDAAGRVPSDEALVDAVITEAAKGSPFFVFAFTNSTHIPYDYDAYRHSPLDVVGELAASTHHKVKTYANALRTADQAIEKLIRHFEEHTEPTVVVILGDHLPALDRDGFDRSAFLRAPSFPEGMSLSHRCPVVIWSNVELTKRDIDLSMNFLGQRILREMGLPLDGFWGLNAAIADRYPVVSKTLQLPDGRRVLIASAPEEVRKDLDAYRLVQYDLLFGDQFSLDHAAARSADGP